MSSDREFEAFQARENQRVQQIDRVVEAVYAANPQKLLDRIESEGLMNQMLENIAQRFGGRSLSGIPDTELRGIARDAADTVLGIEPTVSAEPSSAGAFPAPAVVDTQASTAHAEATLGRIQEVLDTWSDGHAGAVETVEQIEEIVDALPAE